MERAAGLAGGMNRLAISPQCGFASVLAGNETNEDAQWRKLELVGRVADRRVGLRTSRGNLPGISIVRTGRPDQSSLLPELSPRRSVPSRPRVYADCAAPAVTAPEDRSRSGRLISVQGEHWTTECNDTVVCSVGCVGESCRGG